MGATIRSGERGANLDSQSGSNQEVVSVAEPDENEIKEKKENEMKECSDECRSKFRFQLFGKCYLKNENDEVDAKPSSQSWIVKMMINMNEGERMGYLLNFVAIGVFMFSMKVSSSPSEMKSGYPQKNVQKDVENMIGVCASLYENKKMDALMNMMFRALSRQA